MPGSTYFQRPEDRFERDFAAHDKQARLEEKHRKEQIVGTKRARIMERDMKRWESMEQQEASKEQMLKKMRDKYKVGNVTKGGVPVNIISNDYVADPSGEEFKKREENKKNLRMMRGNRNI